jgi:DNA invertase Pin-like site-specific DNA recombinase
VRDASRWSRDNRKSKEGLEILRNNDIKFFAGTREYDLYDPKDAFFIGVSTEMNEYQAMSNALFSITSRIDRAKQGVPVTGKLPHARTWDRKEWERGATPADCWGVDGEQHQNVKMAAKLYLEGTPKEQIAPLLGCHPRHVLKVLKNHSGDVWVQTFQSKRLNLYEEVPTPVPPLLEPEIIEAIHAKANANRTIDRAPIIHKYLLSNFLRCAKCGWTYFGQVKNAAKNRYYKHSHADKECGGKPRPWVPADDIENAVMAHLFASYGDADAMAQAIADAVPNVEEREQLVKDKKRLEKHHSKVTRQIDNLVDAIADGTITKDRAKTKMKELEAQETMLKEEVNKIEPQLAKMPTKKEMKYMADLIKQEYEAEFSVINHLDRMTWDQKRKLVRFVLDGKDLEGKPLGVYVQHDKRAGTWSYIVRGKLFGTSGQLPMDLRQASKFMSWGDALYLFGTSEEYDQFLADEAGVGHPSGPGQCQEHQDEERRPVGSAAGKRTWYSLLGGRKR